MDLYAPAKLKSMGHKQLQEARADIMQEISDLEAVRNRSSVQEVGLRNLRASLEIASDILAERGDGVLRAGGGSGGRPVHDPLELPRGERLRQERRQEQRDHARYMTYRAIDGSPVYAVGSGQRYSDIPGMTPSEDPHAIGNLVRAALTGNRSGLSAEVSAALSEGALTQGGYAVPSVLSSSVIDLMQANSVLVNSGMPVINLTSDNLTIARVTSVPEFSVKIENQEFDESDMTFGAVKIVPKMIGCLIRASLEVIEDGPNFPALIEDTIAKAFAAQIDNYGLNGVAGTQSPKGIFAETDIASTDVAAASLSWLSLSAASLAVKNRNHMPSVALMTPTREHALLESVDLQDRWLGPPPTLANTTILSSTQVPAAKEIIGDFSQFVLGLRNGFRLDFTDVGAGAFEKNQRVFRVYWRGNFAVLDETAFQVINVT